MSQFKKLTTKMDLFFPVMYVINIFQGLNFQFSWSCFTCMCRYSFGYKIKKIKKQSLLSDGDGELDEGSNWEAFCRQLIMV